jgi:hypothetical protein
MTLPSPVAVTPMSTAALSDTAIYSLTALNKEISAGETGDLVSLR